MYIISKVGYYAQKFTYYSFPNFPKFLPIVLQIIPLLLFIFFYGSVKVTKCIAIKLFRN